MKTKRILSTMIGLPIATIFFAGQLAGEARAEFPEKPIEMIVPFGAGGGFDKLARTLSGPLEKALGVSLAIKNNPGAGGRRGSVKLFKSKPDGYTIGFLHFPPFMADEIFFNKKPAVEFRKISIIQMVAEGKDLVFVPKSSPIKTFADLKNAKGTVKFTGTGIGAASWVAVTALSAAAGFKAEFVLGYKSLPRAALGAARGDADAGLAGYRQISGLLNEIRPLVYFSDTKEPHFPNVPTVTELGYPQLAGLGSPYVISAPPGTPQDRLQVIRTALSKAVQQDSYTKWAVDTGYIVSRKGPAATREALAKTENMFKSLVPSLKAAQEAQKMKK